MNKRQKSPVVSRIDMKTPGRSTIALREIIVLTDPDGTRHYAICHEKQYDAVKDETTVVLSPLSYSQYEMVMRRQGRDPYKVRAQGNWHQEPPP